MAHRDISIRQPKKAKRVTGNKPKLKALKELQQVNAQVKKEFGPDTKREKRLDKMFDKQRKLREQLGIDG